MEDLSVKFRQATGFTLAASAFGQYCQQVKWTVTIIRNILQLLFLSFFKLKKD